MVALASSWPVLARFWRRAMRLRSRLASLAHLLAQPVHVAVGERAEGRVHELVHAFVGALLAHVFGNALAGKLVDLLLHAPAGWL